MSFCLTFSQSTQQNNDTTTAASKPVAAPAPPVVVITDTTALLQWRDYQELAVQLQELPAKYANPIMEWMNKRFEQRAKEYTNAAAAATTPIPKRKK